MTGWYMQISTIALQCCWICKRVTISIAATCLSETVKQEKNTTYKKNHLHEHLWCLEGKKYYRNVFIEL